MFLDEGVIALDPSGMDRRDSRLDSELVRERRIRQYLRDSLCLVLNGVCMGRKDMSSEPDRWSWLLYRGGIRFCRMGGGNGLGTETRLSWRQGRMLSVVRCEWLRRRLLLESGRGCIPGSPSGSVLVDPALKFSACRLSWVVQASKDSRLDRQCTFIRR